MKIQIEDRTYEGTGVEIMEALRNLTFDPEEYGGTEGYIRQLQCNFIRSTSRDCRLPNRDTEKMARAMFAHLAKVDALEILDDG